MKNYCNDFNGKKRRSKLNIIFLGRTSGDISKFKYNNYDVRLLIVTSRKIIFQYINLFLTSRNEKRIFIINILMPSFPLLKQQKGKEVLPQVRTTAPLNDLRSRTCAVSVISAALLDYGHKHCSGVILLRALICTVFLRNHTKAKHLWLSASFWIPSVGVWRFSAFPHWWLLWWLSCYVEKTFFVGEDNAFSFAL